MGSLMGTPAMVASVVVPGSPAMIGATSVLVPPMSKLSTSEKLLRRAISAAPTTPAAGPDSTKEAARPAAVATSTTPPEDCIINGAGTPRSSQRRTSRLRYPPSLGPRYASAAVVEKRSYSRNSGSTPDESDTCAAGRACLSAAPTCASCSGCRYENSRHTATASTSAAATASTAAFRLLSSSGVSSPSGTMRSRTVKRSSLGTSGGGRLRVRSYSDCRFWRPISRTSRKPSVVTSAVRAPLRSSSALVATVEPCATVAPLTGPMPAASSAAITPSDWSAVVGTLAVTIRPSTRATRSVNVPPTSTPIRSTQPSREQRGPRSRTGGHSMAQIELPKSSSLGLTLAARGPASRRRYAAASGKRTSQPSGFAHCGSSRVEDLSLAISIAAV